nr:OmpW family outer membrane protein [uncultured Neokomagataea sp.]
MKISSMFMRILGVSTALMAVAPVVASAQSTAYTTAPMVTLNAPKVQEKCGLFETCANTKQGLGKGDFLVRVSALGVLPENTYSRVGVIGGHVSATNQVMPELTFEYFLTDHISVDLIAASTRHELAVQNSALGKVDLGSTWVLPPTITAAWHFRPHHRFNPYIGAGMTLAFFYNINPAGGAVQKLDLRTTVGPAANIGFDYQVAGNWFVNVDAKQMFLSVPAYINERGGGAGPFIHARDSLNPTTVAAGIEYRF